MKKIFTLILCALTTLMANAQLTAAGLTVVGETSFTIEQEPAGDWGSTMYEIPTPGIAEALGMEKAALQEAFIPMFYGELWDYAFGEWGELMNNGNVDVPAGFYFRSAEVADAEGNPVIACFPTTDWSQASFFFHKGAYDPENDVVTLGCGQNPAATERVAKHTFNIFIVNEELKAYAIHFTVNIEAPEQEGLDALTSIGGEDWVVDMRDPRNGWDVLDSYQLDMESILAKFSEAMGKEVAMEDLALMALNEYDGVSYMYTADNYDDSKGFWFTAATGKTQVYNWATQSYFINYDTQEGALYVGHMPNVFSGGEEMSTKLYLVADGTHYYEINFTMTMAAPTFTLEQCEMQEMQMVVQLVPSTDGAWEVRRLDVGYIEEMLGAADLKFYGVTADSLITANYSVSEADQGGGGFWMSACDEDGWAHAAGYTGNGAFAIWYTGAGEMVFFNVPGLPQIGDKAKSTFYMANLWDGQAVKIDMVVRYVAEIKEITPLATEDIVLPGRDEAGQLFSETEIDLTNCLTLFNEQTGEDVDDIMEKMTLVVINPDGDLTTEGLNAEGLFTFNADGEQVAEDDENAIFRIGMADNLLFAYIISDENLQNEYKATVYVVYEFEFQGEGIVDEETGEAYFPIIHEQYTYAYNVTVKGGESDNIAVVTLPTNAPTFDLMGRPVAQPTKGLYIRAGKKFLSK